MLPDEIRQQPLAGGVLDHLHRYAPAPKQLLLAAERPVLADHHPRNPEEQNRPAAHGAGRERGVERAAPVHRRGLPAGPLQGIHFGVEDHAAGLLATVVPTTENAVIPDQDGADGDAAFAQALAGFVQGGLEELVHGRRYPVEDRSCSVAPPSSPAFPRLTTSN